MKTNFDEIIRRKLESIDSQPSAEDIERVYRYTRPAGNSWRRIWPFFFVSVLTATLLTVILFQREENLRLSAQMKKMSAIAQQTNKTITRKQTVKQSNGEGNTQAEDTQTPINKEGINLSSSQNSRQTFSGYTNRNVRLNTSHPFNNSRDHEAFATHTNGSVHENSQNSAPVNIQEQTASKGNLSIINDTAKANIDSIAIKKTAKIKPDSLAGGKKPLTKPADNIFKPGFRIGLAYSIASNVQAVQLSGEVSVSHFFFDAGVRKVNINESYTNREAYTERRENNFDDVYPVWKPSDPVKDIRIQSQLWQLPLSLGYRRALPKEWAISASAGTYLDLTLQQHLECDGEYYRGSYGYWSHYAFDFHPQVLAFNNISASAGIEKAFGRLITSVNPYFVYRIKKVNYKFANETGVRFALDYRF